MFLKGLPVIVGISLLCGVATSVIFSETKYYGRRYFGQEVSEISENTYRNPTTYPDNYRDLHVKKKQDYELGALTAVSVFAGLLILNGLRKGKKPTSEN